MNYYQTNAALPDYVSIQNEPDFASSGTNYQYRSRSRWLRRRREPC